MLEHVSSLPTPPPACAHACLCWWVKCLQGRIVALCLSNRMKFALWDQVMKHYYSAWAQGWRRHWARWQTPNTQRPCTQTMWNEQAPSNSFLLTCHAVHSNFVRSILAKVTMLQGFRYKGEKLGGFVLISMGLSLMNDCNACMQKEPYRWRVWRAAHVRSSDVMFSFPCQKASFCILA